MKTLVTGASGFLGAKLMSVLDREHEVVGTYMTKEKRDCIYLDVTNGDHVYATINNLKPDITIHTAAISAPDLCESDREKAWKLNVEGTRNIASACKRSDSKLVYISTDYVFDGGKGDYTEDDEPRPLNYYGLTKLKGEKIIRSELANHLIIRVPIFYGFNDEEDRPSFVTRIISKLRSDEEVYVDDDQIRYPVWIDDIALVINELIKRDARGTYHFNSKEPITKYQWALKIADIYGLPREKIYKTTEPQGGAKRPHNSKLNTLKIEELGIKIKPVRIEEGLIKMKKQMGCLFRMIYSVRPDMLVLGQNASSFRVGVGEQLAKEHPVNADITVGIPETGMFPATGYAMRSRIPFSFGLIRDYYTQKTLLKPSMDERLKALREKLIPVPDIVRNKKIVLIDEAIISGSTLSVAINKLKRAGAKEIHVRIPSPPMLSNCRNGVLNPNAQLIAPQFSSNKNNIEQGLAKHLGCDSMRFLSSDQFLSFVHPDSEPCFECFTP